MPELDPPVVQSLPSPTVLRHRLGDALREVELLRALVRLAEKAERYRERDRALAQRKAVKS